MNLNANRPYSYISWVEREASNHDGINDQYRHLENVERRKENLPKNSKNAAREMENTS
jgi:hypothetical protein